MRKRSTPERVREGDTGHVGPTEEVRLELREDVWKDRVL